MRGVGGAGGTGGTPASAVDSTMSRAGRATAPAASLPSIGERHVHRPVPATVLAELAGAVEGVDDPHAARVEPGRAVECLLRQDGVVRPQRREPLEDQPVGSDVAVLAEPPPSNRLGRRLFPQREQRLAGLHCDRGRDLMVVGVGTRGIEGRKSADTPDATGAGSRAVYPTAPATPATMSTMPIGSNGNPEPSSAWQSSTTPEKRNGGDERRLGVAGLVPPRRLTGLGRGRRPGTR